MKEQGRKYHCDQFQSLRAFFRNKYNYNKCKKNMIGNIYKVFSKVVCFWILGAAMIIDQSVTYHSNLHLDIFIASPLALARRAF